VKSNEGRFVGFLPERLAAEALAILREHPLGAGATRIGSVAAVGEPLVTIRSRIGATRILDLLSGEQLPRIC
jgi:hydrogenase expression/formation protein HypE